MPLHLVATIFLSTASQGAPVSEEFWLQVLDAASDTPIDGARVHRSFAPRALLRQYEPFSGNDLPLCRTDARGVVQFTLHFVEDRGGEAVLVGAPGYESHLQPLGPGTPFVRGRRIVHLERLRPLAGHVHDPDAESPHQGPEVLEVVVSAWLANPERAPLVCVPVWDSLYRPTELVEAVRPDGSFGPILVPRADLVTVQVSDPSSQWRSEPVVIPCAGPLPPVELRLPKRAIVSARVPAGGGLVAIERDHHGADAVTVEVGVRGWNVHAMRRVGSDRPELLARVWPGRWRVGLALDAAAEVWCFRSLELAPGEVLDLTVERPALRPVTGRVVDRAGLPVRRAAVSWWPLEAVGLLPHTARAPAAALTAEDGTFRLEHVLADDRPGELRVALDGTGAAEGVSVEGLPPGTAHRIVRARESKGAVVVLVEADGASDVWCHVARQDGSWMEPRSQEWRSLSSPLRPGQPERLTRQVLEAGTYCILGYEQSGACRVAETLVELAAGTDVEVVLPLRSPATLELRPPIGAVEATGVTLRRGDVHVVSFEQSPILPTPIALAPGPMTVTWRTASGARCSRTVELTAGAAVTVVLDG